MVFQVDNVQQSKCKPDLAPSEHEKRPSSTQDYTWKIKKAPRREASIRNGNKTILSKQAQLGRSPAACN